MERRRRGEGTRVVVLLSTHLGFQGEFPVGVVEGKGLLLFQHLSQGSVDPQRLQVIGYLTTRPGSGKRGKEVWIKWLVEK